jgi:hypothetical protein
MGLFDRFRKPKGKPRVAVIGLDGVGAPLIEALTDAGVMPRMAALRRGGTLARMTSSIPTISSVSWSGFMTGTNPGRHGIYGFTDVKRDSYAVYFPNYRHVQGATTPVSAPPASGRSSSTSGTPTPPVDIQGVLVSGFVAVNIERAVTRDRAVAAEEPGLQDRRRLRERQRASGRLLQGSGRHPGGAVAHARALPARGRRGLFHRRHRDRPL